MTTSMRSFFRAGWEQLVRDLRADRWLRYILLLSIGLSAFWFWHRIPNFATRDEISRILDALVPYARVIEDPSLESLRSGILWGRVPFGATTYLYGIVFLPLVFGVLLLGEADAFTALAYPAGEFGFYEPWHTTPEWVWTWSLSLVRLLNVLFAVGSVYLTYRIGVELANRKTGRLASLVLTLTFGFLTIAHEGGEDMPAAFFLLLAVLLLIRYVHLGDGRFFLAASAAGGLAIGFKLTAAPVVLVIGLAYLLRAADGHPKTVLANPRPKLVVTGALVGLVVILFSFPSTAIGRFDLVLERIFGGSVGRATHTTGPDAPILWWFLRGYFSALGLPLFFASVAGVLASLWHLRRRPVGSTVAVLVLGALGSYILLFSAWHDFRVHHLLPTFPLLAIIVGWSLSRFQDRAPAVGRLAIALVLVTSAVYAGVGVAEYAHMPRDQATEWLETNGDEDAVVEVYRRHIQDTAIPHSMNVTHAYGSHGTDERLDPCPTYIQLGYRDLLYRAEGTYYRNGPVKANYLRKLLDGEYGYEIAAEFGPRPPNFVPDRPMPGNYTDLLRLGVVPHTDQYADEQELAENQYTVILEQTGECDRSRYPPF
ncbi:ArnT family glycosyltransferase [Halodesulfurarchaeum sp.]|uniref:ArnT family glycosyltransferase n=1 Tax=Halodesulfurarchaeum sp. TaxID=1980530 RepID=UPI002FC378B0